MVYQACKIGSAVVACESYKKGSKRPPSALQAFRFKELEMATEGFSVETLLGKGSHGYVYKGVLANGKLVAVKRPSNGRQILRDEAAFDNEIRILSKLNNPRLVKLVGLCHDSKEKLLVVEFMPNGTLYDILHNRLEPLSWSKRIRLALQTAKAVLDLHKFSPPIIHRDIKSSNILIDSHWNAKLGDFGLALCGQFAGELTPPAGTLGYLDPEYTTPEMLSTKNDVFSFGILLLEIISGRNAIDVHYNPPRILDWAVPLIKHGQVLSVCDPRLGTPKNTSALKQMAALAARCVRSKSSKRPDMSDVVRHLGKVCRRIDYSSLNDIAQKMKKNIIGNKKKQQIVEQSNVLMQTNTKLYNMAGTTDSNVRDEKYTSLIGVISDTCCDKESVSVNANSSKRHYHSTVMKISVVEDQDTQHSANVDARKVCLVDLFEKHMYRMDSAMPHHQKVHRDSSSSNVSFQQVADSLSNRESLSGSPYTVEASELIECEASLS